MSEARVTAIRDERGVAILVMVFIMAFVFSLVAYANIVLAIVQARQTQFFNERPDARSAVEAGWVIAKERLWSNPSYCGGTHLIDRNGNGAADAGEYSVTVTVTPQSGSCPNPSVSSTIQVQLAY